MAIASGQLIILQPQDAQLLLLQILQICEHPPENLHQIADIWISKGAHASVKILLQHSLFTDMLSDLRNEWDDDRDDLGDVLIEHMKHIRAKMRNRSALS